MTFRNILFILIFAFLSCKTAKVETITEQPLITEINTLEFPKRIGYVNDFENIFTADEIKFMENALLYYSDHSNREITIITLASIPENITFEDYAIRISNTWGVGENNNKSGLSIVLSKTLRKVRISTTEKARNSLTDEFCKKVIDEQMIPEFKKGNYNDGVLLGIDELIREWK